MSTIWIATLVTSLICFLLKLAGYSLPHSLLNKEIVQRINTLIPISLLSALVTVQSFGDAQNLVLDHRVAGVGAAAIALKFKASFPIMMLLAAAVSAAVYRI